MGATASALAAQPSSRHRDPKHGDLPRTLMKFVRSAALVVIIASVSACGGGAPGVPPMEFRLNSPAPPQSMTSVQNDNHFEAHQTHIEQNYQVINVNAPAEPARPVASPPPVASAQPLPTSAPPPPAVSQAMPLPP